MNKYRMLSSHQRISNVARSVEKKINCAVKSEKLENEPASYMRSR